MPPTEPQKQPPSGGQAPFEGGLSSLNALISKYSDLVLAGLVITVMGMIVIPLPKQLLDVLLTINITGALIILLIGPIVAKLLSRVVHRLAKELKLDRITDELGVSEVLKKGGMKHPLSEGMGFLVYWLFVIIFLMITVKMIGLPMISDSVDKLMVYVPHVLSSVIVLTLGIIIAKVISGLVYFVGVYTDLPNPKTLERITRWAIVISAAMISLQELGLSVLLVGTNFQIVFAAVCFAFALAYGLGGRDVAAKHLGKYSK